MEARLKSAQSGLRRGHYGSGREAASALAVPTSTLAHRMAGRSTREEAHVAQQKLSEAEEQVLEEWILRLHKMGFPATLMMMKDMANHLLRKQSVVGTSKDVELTVGRNWIYKFKRRHPRIQAAWSRRLASKRFEAMDSELFNEWFTLFKSVVEEHDIVAGNTYNMDEKGCIMGLIGNSRVLVSAQAKEKFMQQPGTRESVTVIECISAIGQVLPPFIIWSAKTHRNAWYPIDMDPRMHFAVSPNGYTDDVLGSEWLEECFDPSTREKADGKNRLLIMDGHGSHLTGRFLGFCLDNNILPLCLPAHTTHVLQPLDVGCFGPVAHYYRRGVETICRQGVKGVSKHQFVEIYTAARTRGLSPSNIVSAFRHAGLFPYNPHRVMRQLPGCPRTPTRRLHPETPPHPPSTPPEQVTTPRSPRQVQHTMARMHDDIMFPILETPTRVRIQKLEKAVSISFAERALLQHKVDELTIENSSKRQRTDLDQSILSRGRLITMEDVVRIREEEAARKTQQAEKVARRQEKQQATVAAAQSGREAQDTSQVVAAVPWELWTSVLEF